MGGPSYRAPHESQWLTDLVNGCVSTLLLIHQVSLYAALLDVHPESISRSLHLQSQDRHQSCQA